MTGYCLFPDIRDNRVIFVNDNDLWEFNTEDRRIRKIIGGMGIITTPRISPDGKWIAFRSAKSASPGPAEIYLVPSAGGEAIRTTFFGSPMTSIAGWSPEGKLIVSTDSGRPFVRWMELYEFGTESGGPEALNLGPATAIEYSQNGVVLARNSVDLPQWKRYRGGARGKFWKDTRGDGIFSKFLELDGNLTSPMWVGDRLYFISDHEGTGNLYSVNAVGTELRQHTQHSEFFARNARSDGRNIVYQCGGCIYLFDTVKQHTAKLEIETPAARLQTKERFIDTGEFLEECVPDTKGEKVLLVVRGKLFLMGNWDGAVTQLGTHEGVRYRLGAVLHSGNIAAVSDEHGEESIEILDSHGKKLRTVRVEGSVMKLEAAKAKDLIAYSTNRFDIRVLDVSKGSVRAIDRSEYGIVEEFSWSPDGTILAYSFPEKLNASTIRLATVASGRKANVTEPNANDFSPAFDPSGRYLYFLSDRELDPVYDKIIFDLGFPKAARPFAVTLRDDMPSPFIKPAIGEKKETNRALKVDMVGIKNRVEPFPVEGADFVKIRGTSGKALFLSFPVEGLKKYYLYSDEKRKGTLMSYDFDKMECEEIASGITDFALSGDSSQLLLNYGNDIRMVDASRKVEPAAEKKPGKRSGYIDLGRIKATVNPPEEWKEMLRETWRLMRENYWREDMLGRDWTSVHKKYSELLPGISTRYELSDLIREMQGELGTSHSYESGGDYNSESPYIIGSLGADFELRKGSYHIRDIYVGDPANDGEKSPLLSPGVNARKGDRLLSINGVTLSARRPPGQLLENRAGDLVTIVLERGRSRKSYTVRTLKNEKRLLYRAWVEKNRKYVHERTGGRIGYLHIPDMGPNGFAEFHRIYRIETEMDGLIVDVRYNSGGSVSALLLEKLARKRIGYDRPRRGKPIPYPPDSVKGPMVAITNELAGSDGDIFSHGFKLLELGPLIGTRTWGGVIGINPRIKLADGTRVTQPQFAFWFKDVGWGVENYGTDPTIEVEIAPQDYRAGKDPQLERAITEIDRMLGSSKTMLDEPRL